MFLFVTVDVNATAPIKNGYYINKILWRIWLNMQIQRDIIYYDSTNSFINISMFTEKDISDLSTEFLEGPRIMKISIFGCAELKGWKHYLIGSNTLPYLRIFYHCWFEKLSYPTSGHRSAQGINYKESDLWV